MSNPVFVNLTADAWTKVGTAVTNILINKISNNPHKYLYTFVLTGEAAPELQALGIGMFNDGEQHIHDHSEPVDFYIFAVAQNGQVEVEI